MSRHAWLALLLSACASRSLHVTLAHDRDDERATRDRLARYRALYAIERERDVEGIVARHGLAYACR